MKTRTREKIEKVILEIYGEKFKSPADIPSFSVEYTDEKFGDLATNISFVLAKRLGESPAEVAKQITDLVKKDQLFETVEIAGNGFINFRLAFPFYQQKVNEIVSAGNKYADSDLGADLKVNVEFISANPTGPLTLGNGRGGYGGDCLARVLEAFGAKVEREYYVNDRGAQVIALGHSILKDDQAVYKGKYISDIADKINSKDPSEAGKEAAAIIMEEYIKKTIGKMGINFDRWSSEAELYKGPIEEVMGIIVKHNLTYEREGALWLKTTEFGDDKDRVLITQEGDYTYLSSDLAYHWDKIKRGYNLLIDIWGADHHGYIGRMKAAIEILEREAKSGVIFKVLIAQLVRLISKGKEVKMSKRLGTYVTLDELIDDVGPDVARYFFLERSFDTHMDFDLDLAKERSQKNPVYYVQYAHARISSILSKSKSYGQEDDLSLLKEKSEISLIKELTKLPDLVIEIAENYQVQKLPAYSYNLATAFHNFYEKCRVISEDENLTSARLKLVSATQIVLKKTLTLMGISAPEKM